MNRLREETLLRMYRIEARSEQEGRCAYCRSEMKCRDTTADHVKPRSLGGATVKDNIVAACSPCNIAKGSLSAAVFRKLIKSPGPHASYRIWRAWLRRKLSLRIERAERRILASAGIAVTSHQSPRDTRKAGAGPVPKAAGPGAFPTATEGT
jgi:HNH endonuclease